MSVNGYAGPKRLPPQAHKEGIDCLQSASLFDIPLCDLHPNDVRAALGLYAYRLELAERENEKLRQALEMRSSSLILPPGAGR